MYIYIFLGKIDIYTKNLCMNILKFDIYIDYFLHVITIKCLDIKLVTADRPTH